MIHLPKLCMNVGEKLPTPEEIVQAVKTTIELGEPPNLVSILATMGAPTDDLIHNPFSAQIGLMGYADGRAYYHHELRGYFPVPEELSPEVSVWESGESMPVWRNGILETPKYFSFGVETVMVPYHPNFRRKWRVHELLHTLSGFFWNPQMNRFSIYLGSRLSELIPIVHWYGLDEIFRPRCPKHEGKLLYREYCPVCEKGYLPYWDIKPETMNYEHALKHAQHALSHFQIEMAACKQEAQTGKRVSTPRVHLDASSDSVGYLKGHWNRLTAWSFGAFIERFMIPEVDYCPTIEGLISRVESLFGKVLSGGVVVDPARGLQTRLRRVLQDVGYRSFMALEWCDDPQVEETILPAIDACADLAHRLLQEDINAQTVFQSLDELEACFAMFSDKFPAEVLQAFPHLGYRWHSKKHATHSVSLGLMSAFPETTVDTQWQGEVDEFVSSSEFMNLGPLSVRFANWYNAHRTSQFGEKLSLESWLLHKVDADLEGEMFGVLPPESGWTDGVVRCNSSMRRRVFSPAAIQHLLGWDTETNELCSIIYRGELQLIPVEPEVAKVFSLVVNGGKPQLSPLVWELLESGFLIWEPCVN